MSSILIKGMKMPKERESFTVTIKYNGLVFDTETGIQVAEAQEIPPHGKLGDLDESDNYAYDVLEICSAGGYKSQWEAAREMQKVYRDAPAIIEADCLPVHHGTFAATSKEEAIRCLTEEDKT